MQLSPMNQGVRAVGEAVEEPDDQEDPPKIRVVVRKRPMNRKVSLFFAFSHVRHARPSQHACPHGCRLYPA